ncbi:FAD-dependent monooxygenase [Micromonospora sp. NPDC005215]|uniref:FAD-dependent monooxygenase n=1 Tax=Micromonospora sp. NPDC005215 TaxID=3157024 RepID=UPI0033B67577
MSDVLPVVVAGAGPTGLMLAAELALVDVPVIVLDRLPEPMSAARAFAIHMSSVHMFHQRGLDQFEGARTFMNYNFGFPGVTALDAADLPLVVSQRRVEQVLEDRVAALGVRIRYGHELVGLEQDDLGVTVRVRGGGEEYDLRASYLVGCDGGRSTVRKLADFAFPGTDSTVCGRTGDVEILDERYQGGIGQPIYPTGLAAVIPHPDEPGMWRATAIEFDSDRAGDEVPVTLEEFQAAFHRITGIDLKIGRYGWFTRFGNATRLAERYRDGRVLLAGDAAHIHFPSAGQGLNTGIQDAMNLGWKLAAAVRGWGGDELLDSYHHERWPIGREACVYPQVQTALIHPPQTARPLREFIGALMKFDEVSRYIIERATGLGIRYPMAYGGDPAPEHPLLGYRIPDIPLRTAAGETSVAVLLRDGRGLLIDARGGTASPGFEDWADRLRVVAAEPADGLGGARVLVRPDGHVAYVDVDGTGDERLRTAVTHWFGTVDPSSAAPSPAMSVAK